MTTKTPFIESYLEQFGDDKEIKEILQNEKCKVISCSKIEDKKNMSDYNYMAILGLEQLKHLIRHDKQLFKNSEKIYFMDEYDSSCDAMINRLHKYLKGIKIILNKDHIKTISLPNYLKNISIETKFEFDYESKKYKFTKYFDYLPSSTKVIEHQLDDKSNKINNFPNKTLILNVLMPELLLKTTKVPMNIILITSMIHTLDDEDIKIKKIFKIKTQKTLIKIHELEKHNKNNINFKKIYFSIIKTSENIELVKNKFKYDLIKEDNVGFGDIEYYNEIIKKNECNIKYIWNMISSFFVVYNEKHDMCKEKSLIKSCKLINGTINKFDDFYYKAHDVMINNC